MEVITSVGVHPYPIGLLGSEVPMGQGVAQQVYLLPLPVRFIQWRVHPDPPIRPIDVRLARRLFVAVRYFCVPPVRIIIFPPFGLPRRPLPFPDHFCPIALTCFICCSFCWGWGAMLAHFPR